MRLIERHIKSIAALCRKYKVNRLFVFGSVLTDRFNDGSDIDTTTSTSSTHCRTFSAGRWTWWRSRRLGTLISEKAWIRLNSRYMDDSISKHLHDILDAINEVESFFGDKPKYFGEFCDDLCLRRAVERDIEIIGEAMNRILKEDRDIAITNSRKIVDARNYIIHGYDSLSADILWSIVINHLPKLKEEVQSLLEQ